MSRFLFLFGEFLRLLELVDENQAGLFRWRKAGQIRRLHPARNKPFQRPPLPQGSADESRREKG